MELCPTIVLYTAMNWDPLPFSALIFLISCSAKFPTSSNYSPFPSFILANSWALTSSNTLYSVFWYSIMSKMSEKCFMNSSKSITPSPLVSATIATVMISGFVKSIFLVSDKHFVYSVKSRVPFMFLSYLLKVLKSSMVSRFLFTGCYLIISPPFFSWILKICCFLTSEEKQRFSSIYSVQILANYLYRIIPAPSHSEIPSKVWIWNGVKLRDLHLFIATSAWRTEIS